MTDEEKAGMIVGASSNIFELTKNFAEALHHERADEREACAKLVQEMGKSVNGGYNNAAFEMAEAIRNRK